jgi:hypothetical protein
MTFNDELRRRYLEALAKSDAATRAGAPSKSGIKKTDDRSKPTSPIAARRAAVERQRKLAEQRTRDAAAARAALQEAKMTAHIASSFGPDFAAHLVAVAKKERAEKQKRAVLAKEARADREARAREEKERWAEKEAVWQANQKKGMPVEEPIDDRIHFDPWREQK